MLIIPSAVTLLLSALLWLRLGHPALLGLLALPWWWLRARRLARFAGYALTDSVIAVRSGWPGHYWRLAERSEEHTSELQSLMRISYAVFCLKKQKHNNKA